MRRRRLLSFALAAGASATNVACWSLLGGDLAPSDAGAHPEKSADAGQIDGGVEDDAPNATDSGSEAGPDSGSEAGPDSGSEAGPDSGSEAGPDPDASSQTATFSMNQPSCAGMTSTATLDVTLTGNNVSVHRTPLTGYTDSCFYAGTMSADCTSVNGTFFCGPPNNVSGQWSATISGQSAGKGRGCSLGTTGTTWREHEASTGTTGCQATWTEE